jgi:hypothetical protein
LKGINEIDYAMSFGKVLAKLDELRRNYKN